jgi:hypothetical protein
MGVKIIGNEGILSIGIDKFIPGILNPGSGGKDRLGISKLRLGIGKLGKLGKLNVGIVKFIPGILKDGNVGKQAINLPLSVN